MKPIVDKLMRFENKVTEMYEQYQEIKKTEGVINAYEFSAKHQLDRLLSARSNIEKYLDEMIDLIDK